MEESMRKRLEATKNRLQEIDEEQCAIATILLVMEGYKNFKILTKILANI